jgi:hypothetical protein
MNTFVTIAPSIVGISSNAPKTAARGTSSAIPDVISMTPVTSSGYCPDDYAADVLDSEATDPVRLLTIRSFHLPDDRRVLIEIRCNERKHSALKR